MSKILNDEIPERDVIKTSQMVDNLETQSTASSDISESLRDVILGRTSTRRHTPGSKRTSSQDTLASYVVVPSKESIAQSKGDHRSISEESSFHSFEIVENLDKRVASGDNIRDSRRPSYHKADDLDKPVRQMKASDDRRYTTIETQTVAIQTVTTGTDSNLDCKCTWGDQYDCICQDCKCRNFRYPSDPTLRDKKRAIISEETTDASNFENYTDSSSHAMEEKESRRFRCTCNCRNGYNYDSATEPLSDSDDSYTTDFLDLPYQNNEEYLKLLRELEKKLVARNRDRVRRTMMEFEKKSRMNQNLEKPVSDYSDDGASMLRKLGGKSGKKKSECCECCKCGKKRVNSDILQNEKRWEDMNYPEPVEEPPEMEPPSPHHRIERSMHKSHWKLDPRSGEWVKVSCFQQTDFSRPPRGDYVKDDYKGHKKECCCRRKKAVL